MSDTTTPAGNPGGDTPASISAVLADLPARIRIHALAKLLGRSSREVLTAVTDLGADGRSVQSSIDRETALRVAESFGLTEPPAEPTPEPSSEPAAAEPPEEPARRVPPTPVFASASPLFLPPEPPVAPAAPPVRKPEPRDEDETDADTDTTDSADDGDDGDDSRPRRRRGRRGRGRGKGGQDENGDESADDEPARPAAEKAEKSDKPEKSDKQEKPEKPEKAEGKRRGKSGKSTSSGSSSSEDAEAESTEDEQPEAEESDAASRRRRRRRRRKGGGDDDGGPTEDDPPNTVVHVREARDDKDKGESDGRDEVRSVRGSTRLEAKRQRRRDGREAGRRRAPILSEAEFLARREAVDRAMVVRERGDRVQIGVLEDGVLVEHFVTSAGSGSLVGNVYLGRVQNVLPSMEAAFVDIGRGRNAVLYAGEVDWDAAGLEGKARKIEQALSTGDSVLVQVTKDPVGHKGARLTTQISLPGRFLVYVPGGGATGISRKLPENERRRLKDVLKRVVPEDAGVIIRTASEGISEDELGRDVRRLQAQWQVIQEKTKGGNGVKKANAPALVYEEPDLLVKVVRDLFTEDFSALVVQGGTAWETVDAYVSHVAPELADRVRKHVGNTDVFAEYRIEEQLLKALDRKVWLPSGGYLVIDRTEAMTVIDVNTGKFTGSGGNLEETVTRNNLESAEEIVRQLRLRDIGGIIVIDFIDMVLESNRDLVLRRLTECLGRDRTRHQVAEVTSLGLVQMTRKRVGTGLLEAFGTTCEHCKGRGVLVSTEPMGKASNGHSGGHQHGNRRSRGRGDDAAKDAGKDPGKDAGKDAAAKEAAKAVRDIAAATTKTNGNDPQSDSHDGAPESSEPATSTPARAKSARSDTSGSRRRRGGAPTTEPDSRTADSGSPATEAGSPAAESSSSAAGSGSSAAGSDVRAAGSGSPAGTSGSPAASSDSSAAGSDVRAAGAGSSAGTSDSPAAGSDSSAARSDSRVAGSGSPLADSDSSSAIPAESSATRESSPGTESPATQTEPAGARSADPRDGGVQPASSQGAGVGTAPVGQGADGSDSPAAAVPSSVSGAGAGTASGSDVSGESPASTAVSEPADTPAPGTDPRSDIGTYSSVGTGSNIAPGSGVAPASGAGTGASVGTGSGAASGVDTGTGSGTHMANVSPAPVAEQPPTRARRRSRRSAGQPSVTAAAQVSAAATTAPAGEPSASTVIDPATASDPTGSTASEEAHRSGDRNGLPEQANGRAPDAEGAEHGTGQGDQTPEPPGPGSDVPAVTPPARRPARRGGSRPAGPPVTAAHDG